MSTTLDARASERARPHPTTAWLLPLLRRLHFYAGILVGPFLVVAAVTGALYVFTPQLERERSTRTRSPAPSPPSRSPWTGRSRRPSVPRARASHR